MSNYPMHEKLKKVRHDTQAIGEFLEWLRDTKQYALCYLDRDEWVPSYDTIKKLLEEYTGIDDGVLQEEKQSMLNDINRRN